MYYIVFGILYLFSLLPFWVLYRVSDFFCFIIYRVIGYRKKVVTENLKNSFPEKTEEEIRTITQRFYQNFCDTWIEMIKMISINKNTLAKRIQHDFSLLEELYKTGQSVQIFAGHFMNWEYTTASVPNNQPYPLLGVYMPVGSKIFDRLIQYLRSRYGTILLRAGHVARDMEPWKNKPHLMGLIADQSPSNPQQAHWFYFMNQPAGFIRKPWVLIRRQKQPAVYLKVNRLKRGYFFYEVLPITLDPANADDKEMALRYRDLLEADIRNNPDNYLWTHRRWKKKWQPEYRSLWVDTVPAPPGTQLPG